ncbi:MAG: winged helix-turn-helix transcriptional regulator [Ruminococcaceae bacterium]|nr:winged helix-turn-helix transcriptional regulator [Oscillospiraceae bacterium]
MFEKNLQLSFLLDQYGAVLGERHRTLLDYYYNQDLSLSEIAAEVGISRQGVRDSIKKAEEELLFLEERLHLHQRALQVADAAEALLRMPLADDQRLAVEKLIVAAGGNLPQK